MLTAREGSTLDSGGVYRLGADRLRDLRADLARLYREHPGLRDQARGAGHPASTAELLARYRSEVERARRFCIEQEVVTLPDGEDCEVAATPAFRLALLPVASYSPPPLLAPATSLRGRFLVPAPPAGIPAGQAARSLAAQRYAGFPNTVIHETYPGHHAHYAAMSAAVARHRVRALFPSAFFAEGWGVYAEQLARQRGYFTSPEMFQAHLASGAVRAARAAADAALHAGEMPPGQAEAYLAEQVRLPPAMAQAEVDRYLAYPAQAASYLVGATEITRIVAGSAGRQVHDLLISAGSLPLSLAERNAQES